MRWIDPFGAEITEFAGHTDDCGPCANEVALATVQGRSPSTTHMNTIRARDLAAGIFRDGGGQTVQELVEDVQRFEPGVVVKLTPALVNYVAPDETVIHQALKDAADRKNACVINLGNAAALPGNQKGVVWHFVTCIGVDASQGYLICNGDEIPFDGQPNWVTWEELWAAKPVAVVEYMKQGVAVMAGLPKAYLDAGWSDSNGVLTSPPANDKKSYQFVRGFRNFVVTLIAQGKWQPGNVAIENEHLDPDGNVRQLCTLCLLVWTNNAPYFDNLGEKYKGLRAQPMANTQPITKLPKGLYEVD